MLRGQVAENLREEEAKRQELEVSNRELREEIHQLKLQLMAKPKVVEVGVQVSPVTKEGTMEKGKEGAKDRRQEGNTSSSSKQTTKRQVVSAKAEKPQPVKYKPTTKAIDQERSINTRAFVVHGIPCQRPMADTIQDVRKTGVRGIVGARWLLGGQRRAGKTTSSVVIFLSIPISFQVQAGMKVSQRTLASN